MKKIHVGFLLSYDYEKLKLSIPPVYNAADKIFIAEDSNKKTWSGNEFVVDESFYEWLKEFDVDNKIEFYRDDFYIPELTAIQNDTRERHLLSMKMGIGNWLIQIDSDEYFIDFDSFIANLRKYDHYLDNPKKNKIQFACFWLIIYKYTKEGVLFVNKPMKSIFATNYPNYKCARRTNERTVYFDNLVLHESIARTEEQLRYKLKNWGHTNEVDKNFLKKWKMIDETNYDQFEDFYYIEPKRWKKLDYFPATRIKDIKKIIDTKYKIKISKKYLVLKNFGQWFKFVWRKKILSMS
ncbi:hypothetical protein [Flavobacterium sp. CF136]|uniref:hypothetical protein n=1 Tax=Flavobacterium sp. (strain CF136) TaxID=1144313 RepID=UPI000271A858|nr:hypothetical protein [Flavobacterium sp. CF136]EJL60172.1 hypothetical protein PMI10_03940 [Flavobacterium sp. CF136]